MKQVVPRTAAERDIDDVADYYLDEAGEDVARAFLEAVRNTFRMIGERPRIGSARHQHRLNIAALRYRKLARFPYLIFYVENDDHIDVLRVLHVRRDIPAAFRDQGG